MREVTRTRLFAERAMYVAQRMPTLLRWQVELMTGRTLQDPQVSTALTSFNQLADSAARISRASESFSQMAVQLPGRVAAERKAILQRFADLIEANCLELAVLEVGLGGRLDATTVHPDRQVLALASIGMDCSLRYSWSAAMKTT